MSMNFPEEAPQPCYQPHIEVIGPTVDEAFANWFAGFVDGEGCFKIPEQRGRHSTAFQLRLREDDLAVLLSVAAHLQMGRVFGPYQPRPGREGYYSKPHVMWKVQTKSGCRRLVEIFDRFPVRSKKVQDYRIWREAVLEYCSPRPDQARLASLKAELKRGREYTKPAVHALYADLKSGGFSSQSIWP